MWESQRNEIPGEGCTSLPRVKFCLPRPKKNNDMFPVTDFLEIGLEGRIFFFFYTLVYRVMHLLVIFVHQSKISKFCMNSTVFPTHGY